jgi:hypothetical protein
VRISEFSFRSGKETVAKHPEILASIFAAIVNAQEAQLQKPKISIVKHLERELSAERWTKPEQNLSFLKKRVSLEIEFSHYEFVYRDFIRFLAAYATDKIIVGVLITNTEVGADRIKHKSDQPHFERVCQELKPLRSSFLVPIWVVGLR